jgi:hypothetical protein
MADNKITAISEDNDCIKFAKIALKSAIDYSFSVFHPLFPYYINLLKM